MIPVGKMDQELGKASLQCSSRAPALDSSVIPITFSSLHNTKLDHTAPTLQVATIGISLKMYRARATPVSKILIDML